MSRRGGGGSPPPSCPPTCLPLPRAPLPAPTCLPLPPACFSPAPLYQPASPPHSPTCLPPSLPPPPACLPPQIFRSLALQSVPYLPKVLPVLFGVMHSCDDNLREEMLQQLTKLVAYVRQVGTLKPYKPTNSKP